MIRHLLHRHCSRCAGDGWARGFHAAAVEAERRERLIKQLLNEGLDPWQLEESLRSRIAEAEGEAA